MAKETEELIASLDRMNDLWARAGKLLNDYHCPLDVSIRVDNNIALWWMKYRSANRSVKTIAVQYDDNEVCETRIVPIEEVSVVDRKRLLKYFSALNQKVLAEMKLLKRDLEVELGDFEHLLDSVEHSQTDSV